MTPRGGGGIIDRCGNEWVATGSPIITGEQRKFYSYCYKGSSGTNYNTVTPINFDIGTGDYTLEAWVRAVHSSQNAGIIQISQNIGGLTTDGNRAIALGAYYNWLGNGDFIDGSLPGGQWSHKAIVRKDGVVRMYVDGKVCQERGVDVDLSNLKYAVIGNYYDNNYAWGGYIDSIRVSNHAEYTKEFKPRKLSNDKWLYIAENKAVYSI